MTFITILLVAVIIFTSRYLFLEGRLPVRLGSNARDFLRFSGPAVLTAICMPIIFVKDNELNIALSNPYLGAAVVAIATAWKTGNIYWTVGLGMLVFVAYSIV
ncbi:MAG: branched-subunit amino acid transport protein [Oceanicoccus sp.]|jgi:branched-subunit amino acid transport protein